MRILLCAIAVLVAFSSVGNAGYYCSGPGYLVISPYGNVECAVGNLKSGYRYYRQRQPRYYSVPSSPPPTYYTQPQNNHGGWCGQGAQFGPLTMSPFCAR